MGYPVRLELNLEGLLVYLVNYYGTWSALILLESYVIFFLLLFLLFLFFF